MDQGKHQTADGLTTDRDRTHPTWCCLSVRSTDRIERHFSCPFVSPSAREMPPSKSTFWKEKRKKKKKNGRHLCPFMLYRILLFISSIKKIIIKKSGEPVRVTKIWWFIISQKWIHFNEDICIPATEWNNEHLTINRFPICYSHKGFVFLSNILNFFF